MERERKKEDRRDNEVRGEGGKEKGNERRWLEGGKEEGE